MAEEFTERFVAAMEALSVGDPFDPATEVGPLVTAAAVDTIDAQVEDARAKGATILCGGERVVGPGRARPPGFFYRPTVITGITPAMRVATEEVFGPVALLFTAADADEALGAGQRHRVRAGLERVDERRRRAAAVRRRAPGRPGVRQRHGGVHAPAALRRDQELGRRPRAVVARACTSSATSSRSGSPDGDRSRR